MISYVPKSSNPRNDYSLFIEVIICDSMQPANIISLWLDKLIQKASKLLYFIISSKTLKIVDANVNSLCYFFINSVPQCTFMNISRIKLTTPTTYLRSKSR
jgi:hypothetical protein